MGRFNGDVRRRANMTVQIISTALDIPIVYFLNAVIKMGNIIAHQDDIMCLRMAHEVKILLCFSERQKWINTDRCHQRSCVQNQLLPSGILLLYVGINRISQQRMMCGSLSSRGGPLMDFRSNAQKMPDQSELTTMSN